jgi:hypothetical protein
MTWEYDRDGRIVGGWKVYGQYDGGDRGDSLSPGTAVWLALAVQSGEVRTLAHVDDCDGMELVYASATMDTDEAILDRLEGALDDEDWQGGYSIVSRTNLAPSSDEGALAAVVRAVEVAHDVAWGSRPTPDVLAEAVMPPERTARADEDGVRGSVAVVFTEHPGLSQYENGAFWERLQSELDRHGLYYEWVDGGLAAVWPRGAPTGERLLDAAGRPCGLNGDWSCRAWHFGPGAEPNRVGGDVYVLDLESSPPTYAVVTRSYTEDGDDVIFELLEPTTDVAEAVRAAREAAAERRGA